ncbi:MAG: redoxin domain-containing protein [Pseudomonadales bacterium]
MLNKLKRAFVLPWLVLCAFATAYGLWELAFSPENRLAAVGVILATLPSLVFIARLTKTRVGRARVWLSVELLLALGGSLLASLYGMLLHQVFAIGVGLLGLTLYVFWYSKLGRTAGSHLAVGSQLPPVRVLSIDGRHYTPTQAGSPSVLMFVRGNWCPLCVAQISEIADNYRKIVECGAKVFIIAAQSQQQSKELAARFDVPLIFCIDKNNAVARELGLVHEGGLPMGTSAYSTDTHYPTSIVTDETGKIIYSDQTNNYRARPEPQLFLDALASRNT